MKRAALICTFILLSGTIYAQNIHNAVGMAQFRLEDDMSMEQLKDQLRHHAIVNAIEREYGTYVSQESFVDVDDGSTQFRIFGKSTIRGEWLTTTQEDFKEEIRKVKKGSETHHELWLSLKIEGKVRELHQPEIALEYYTANCKSASCSTSIFDEGQPLYFNFKSPVDGNLSIFVIEGDQALRLLPYQNMPIKYQNSIPIKADTEYLFFSSDTDLDYFEGFSTYLIDELIMETEQKEEFITLYVAFSTEEYSKPMLKTGHSDVDDLYETPKSLSASSLKSWMENNRINNLNFHYEQLKLKIVNRSTSF